MTNNDDLDTLRRSYDLLRDDLRQTWNRSVPFGDLLEDRWSRADREGFGEKTSVYDSTVILGRPTVGENCWIGPFSYIDATGGLEIGNWVTVGMGTMIATHSTVKRGLSAGKYEMDCAPTKIGNRVFIAPQCVIEMGVEIGDCCVVMAKSVVKRSFADNSIVYGNPARKVGAVLFDEDGRPDLRFTDRSFGRDPSEG